MRQRDRGFGDVERPAHRVMRRVREIDDDAEPVQFSQDRAAEGVEAAVAGRIRRGIDPVEGFVVAQRHEPHPGRMPDAQGTERIFEPDAAFDRDEGGDLAQRLGFRVVGRPARGQKNVRMSLFDAADHVDLLERGARRVGSAGRLERRPELCSDPAFAEPRNIGVGILVHPIERVGQHVAARRLVDANGPGKVVVTVEHRRSPQDFVSNRQRVVHLDIPTSGGFSLSAPRRNATCRRHWSRAGARAFWRRPCRRFPARLATSPGRSTAWRLTSWMMSPGFRPRSAAADPGSTEEITTPLIAVLDLESLARGYRRARRIPCRAPWRRGPSGPSDRRRPACRARRSSRHRRDGRG